MTKNLSLSKVKVGGFYIFRVEYNYGAGSGSQGWYNVIGKVKEINAEFIRVIPNDNLLAANRRSVKVYNRDISDIILIK